MPSDFDYIFKVGSSGTGNTNLYYPTSVCIDTDLLRLAICDASNNRILLWDLQGGSYINKKTTYGPDNTSFSTPDGICYYNGFFYVCDTGNHVLIRLRARDLKYIDHYGTIGRSGSANGLFSSPRGICHDKTFLYIADSGNNRVMKLILNTLVYSSKNSSLGLTTPIGICYQPQEKAIYVSDNANNRVLKLNTGLLEIDSVGSYGSDNGQFDAPRYPAVQGDKLYICDANNHRIQVFDTATLTYRAKHGTQGDGNAQLNFPYGICTYRDMIIICEQANHRLMFWYNYDPQRAFTPTTYAKFGGAPYQEPFLIAGDELIAGDTYESSPSERWIEESDQDDEIAWEKE